MQLRRVSFSDTDLVSEHYYPKYDYSDYDDINAFRLGFGREETDAVSQPVHPWLANSLPKSPAPKQSTANSLSSFASSAYSNFGDLSSFVTAYAINKGSSVSSKNDSDKSLPSKNDEQQSTPDFYANLNTDTAALIW